MNSVGMRRRPSCGCSLCNGRAQYKVTLNSYGTVSTLEEEEATKGGGTLVSQDTKTEIPTGYRCYVEKPARNNVLSADMINAMAKAAGGCYFSPALTMVMWRSREAESACVENP